MIDRLSRAWRSSPQRSFVLIPIAAAASELARRRSPLRGGALGLVLMAAGYALYRGAGAYRQGEGGGGPGFEARPDRLVRTGPYGVVRNPMYLGHLAFLTGLVALTRSPLAIAGLALQWRRFDERVRLDEARLAARFGHEYAEYVDRVPRWLPRVGGSPYVLYHRIAEPESAAVRRSVVRLGLKPRVDFENAETDGADALRALGGGPTPALWTGERLVAGREAIEAVLRAIAGGRRGG